MKRRTTFGGAALIVAALTLASCASEPVATAPSETPAAPATAAAPAASVAAPSEVPSSAGTLCPDGTIKLGIAKAKTGGFAFFDAAGAQGSEIAVNQLNATGGVAGCQIELTWEDTASDPAQGKQAAANLIANGAQILIVPSDFDIGAPASLAAQEAGIFAMSPEASSEEWTVAAGPNMVAAGVTETDIGKAQALFANEKGWGSTYVVTNEAYNFFKEMERVFTENFAGEISGRSVVAEDATDYSAVVTKIRGLDPAPDFIYLNDYFPHVGTFIKQLRDAGVDIAVLGNPTYASPDFPSVVGPKRMESVFYTAPSFYEGPTADAAALQFVKDYEAAYGSFPPNGNAAAGYQGVLLLARALADAGTTDAAAITAAMTAGRDVSTAGSLIYEWLGKVTSRRVSIISFDATGVAIEAATVDPRTA